MYRFVLLTSIQCDYIIRNSNNELSFAKDYFIIVHNKTILKTVGMKIIFDQMWYIFEYSIMNIVLLPSCV